jgi:hypothetical protein
MKRGYFFILIIAFLIVSGLFFGLYELQLLYYEENKADKIADYISLPILSIIGFLFLMEEKLTLKRAWNLRENRIGKQIFNYLLSIAVAHFIFFRPVISGIILFINTNFGQPIEINIKGNIIDKFEYSGRGAEFYIIVKDNDNNKTYKFDTFGTETRKYQINDRFEKKMCKGFLGLLYLKD